MRLVHERAAKWHSFALPVPEEGYEKRWYKGTANLVNAKVRGVRQEERICTVSLNRPQSGTRVL